MPLPHNNLRTCQDSQSISPTVPRHCLTPWAPPWVLLGLHQDPFCACALCSPSPTLSTVGRLATCPYFGPGHEQETPEGQEEQAEPQGRERDQRRPQLPLEALGQGQE